MVDFLEGGEMFLKVKIVFRRGRKKDHYKIEISLV